MTLQDQIAKAHFAVEYTRARATFESCWIQHHQEAVEDLRQLEAQASAAATADYSPAMVDMSDGALEVFPSVGRFDGRYCRDCNTRFIPRKPSHVLCDTCFLKNLNIALTEAGAYTQSPTPPHILRDNPDLCGYCGAEKYSPECCQSRHHTIQEEDDHAYCGCEPADEYVRRAHGG